MTPTSPRRAAATAQDDARARPGHRRALRPAPRGPRAARSGTRRSPPARRRAPRPSASRAPGRSPSGMRRPVSTAGASPSACPRAAGPEGRAGRTSAARCPAATRPLPRSTPIRSSMAAGRSTRSPASTPTRATSRSMGRPGGSTTASSTAGRPREWSTPRPADPRRSWTATSSRSPSRAIQVAPSSLWPTLATARWWPTHAARCTDGRGLRGADGRRGHVILGPPRERHERGPQRRAARGQLVDRRDRRSGRPRGGRDPASWGARRDAQRASCR